MRRRIQLRRSLQQTDQTDKESEHEALDTACRSMVGGTRHYGHLFANRHRQRVFWPSTLVAG